MKFLNKCQGIEALLETKISQASVLGKSILVAIFCSFNYRFTKIQVRASINKHSHSLVKLNMKKCFLQGLGVRTKIECLTDILIYNPV